MQSTSTVLFKGKIVDEQQKKIFQQHFIVLTCPAFLKVVIQPYFNAFYR